MDHLAKPAGATVEAEALHAIGFPSHDTKQGILISQGTTASASCCCTTCIRNKNDFSILPQWMGDHYRQEIDSYASKIGNDTNIELVVGPDAALRKGENSFEANSEQYKQLTGNGQFHLSDGKTLQVRRDAASCVLPHMLDIPPEKDTLSGMHITQGCFGHLCNVIREDIRIIEEEGPWKDRVSTVMKEVENALKEDVAWFALHKKSEDFDRAISQFQNRIKGMKKQDETPEAIKVWEDAIEQKRIEKIAHAESSEYGRLNQLSKACASLLDDIKSYNASEKKAMGPGVHIQPCHRDIRRCSISTRAWGLFAQQ